MVFLVIIITVNFVIMVLVYFSKAKSSKNIDVIKLVELPVVVSTLLGLTGFVVS